MHYDGSVATAITHAKFYEKLLSSLYSSTVVYKVHNRRRWLGGTGFEPPGPCWVHQHPAHQLCQRLMVSSILQLTIVKLTMPLSSRVIICPRLKRAPRAARRNTRLLRHRWGVSIRWKSGYRVGKYKN